MEMHFIYMGFHFANFKNKVFLLKSFWCPGSLAFGQVASPRSVWYHIRLMGSLGAQGMAPKNDIF